MAKKRYTIRYYKKDSPITTAISNYSELTDLLNRDAKGCYVETKTSENMPNILHNKIAAHNEAILKS